MLWQWWIICLGTNLSKMTTKRPRRLQICDSKIKIRCSEESMNLGRINLQEEPRSLQTQKLTAESQLYPLGEKINPRLTQYDSTWMGDHPGPSPSRAAGFSRPHSGWVRLM
uniref:Uncharacterized protein n=1 Tax=Cacopsylla melanoneura TaxID=428564 RepID=A0A8D8T297_9HEMI